MTEPGGPSRTRRERNASKAGADGCFVDGYGEDAAGEAPAPASRSQRAGVPRRCVPRGVRRGPGVDGEPGDWAPPSAQCKLIAHTPVPPREPPGARLA